MQKINIPTRTKEFMFLFSVLVFYFLWAIIQPLNSSPDEKMRYLVPQFIYNHGFLPVGSDPEIRDKLWGSSYGFTPILSYIVSGVFMKIVGLFTTNEFSLLMAARMVSVLFGVGTVFMTMKISKLLFNQDRYRWLLILFVAFLPQAVFVTSYVNTDSFAIFTTACIVYVWLLGLKSMWSVKHCVYLGISLGLCSLSYYNAYGYLVCSVIFFVLSIILYPHSNFTLKQRIFECIKKGLIVTATTFIIAGWWFIRNAILYNGDFLGNETSDLANELHASPQLDHLTHPPHQELDKSIIHMLINDHWLFTSAKSFIGLFGFHTIKLYQWMYTVYIVFLSAGICGVLIAFKSLFRLKQNGKWLSQNLLHWVMVLAVIFPPLISLYYSYTSDFQAQGRYWLPMLIPFMYFMTLGIKKLVGFLSPIREKIVIICVDIGIILVGLCSYFTVFLPAYM